ncbi:hypothetical protein [Azospirillum ramasamyi]|uniref:hypothetical protein n=1 Tax=Azospirillum ramasamyi TaxID=682998 RepID=UPI0013A68C44|nr:hypothetical protein [Azospirillum ramasamyi]
MLAAIRTPCISSKAGTPFGSITVAMNSRMVAMGFCQLYSSTATFCDLLKDLRIGVSTQQVQVVSIYLAAFEAVLMLIFFY